MAHRSSSDVFGNTIDPFASSSWTQPAAILSPFLTPEQLKWANLVVTMMFVGVMFVLIARACGKTSVGDRCMGCLYFSFVVLRANLTSCWIYFLRAYGEVLRVEPQCKIVVIGDGIALGFGDFVTFFSKQSGVTRRFQNALNVATQSGTLGMNWRVFNRGHFAATSEDWAPSNEKRPKFHNFILRPGSKNLFENTFRRGGIVEDAQIVVVIVGTMDCRVPPGHPGREVDSTIKHLAELVDELRSRGKLVMLCQLHDARMQDDKELGFFGRHHEKNTKIERMWLNNPTEVFEGANFTHTKYHNHRHPDTVHLASSGYEMAATDMLEKLLKMAQTVESKIVMRAIQQDSANEQAEVDAVAAAAGTKKNR
jgi:hypothetical protein